ncbi:hypothetical protein HII31_07536 [Pseudocercospora fuligena]|uniref:F-box domain-containing protein n=1 Tax=Pseudocercospora fuligena TaxID=685502 RepID=A0A8H6REQ9_9PEZI|nr:hypothetical protein HII31_07536 [Pseudocercospora fuligena]
MAIQKLAKESAKLLAGLKTIKTLKAKYKRAKRNAKRKALLKDSMLVAPDRLPHLPPELWVIIGKLAIDAEDEILNRWNSDEKEQNALMRQPGITRTCKVLRDEVLPYWYRTKVTCELWEDHNWWVWVDIAQWLRVIGPQARSQLGRAYILSSTSDATWPMKELQRRTKYKMPFTISAAVPWNYNHHRRFYKRELCPEDQSCVAKFKWTRKITFT